MPSRSAAHSTFVIERRFSAPVARVSSAWSNAEKKRRWLACHDDWSTIEHRLDFQVDGTEINVVAEPDGTVHAFKARFLDIVPEERIVYAYDMLVGDVRISVSLVTVMFERDVATTRISMPSSAESVGPRRDHVRRMSVDRRGRSVRSVKKHTGTPGERRSAAHRR